VQVWVIDTSSVIELRQIPHADRRPVLAALDALVEADCLLFPMQVLPELDRMSDVAHAWAKRNNARATRYGYLYSEGAQVLKRLPRLIDPTKVGAIDPADPYVIALAQALVKDGHTPSVITDDTKNRPMRTSLAAAAGVYGFPSMPMAIFLMTQQIYPSSA
jgi:hypothetical protein